MESLRHLNQENFRPFLVSQLRVCENGTKKEKLSQLLQKVDTEGISTKSWRNLKNTVISTLESPLQSKGTIFNDRSITSKRSFPLTRSLKTSDLDSISKERDYSVYWNTSSQEVSTKLWLPTKTDSVALDLTSLSSSSKSMEPFLQSLQMKESKNLSKNSPMMSFQSLQFSPPDTMEQENITMCRKIRIYPTPQQIQLFNRCLGTNRYFYNKANHFVKSKYQEAVQSAKASRQELIDADNGCIYLPKKGKNKGKQCCKEKVEDTHFCKKHQEDTKLPIDDYSYLNRIAIRNAIMVPDKELSSEDLWQKDIPYDTRQFAIDQLLAAYKSNFALKRTTFDVSYKTKKGKTEIFQIEERAINFNKMKVFTRRLKKSFRVRKRDLETIKQECNSIVTCLKVKPGKWYLCIPRTKKVDTSRSQPYESVFLDPGVRTFQTFYSPDGICGKMGDAYCDKFIKPITTRIDSLESVRSHADNWKTRRNLKNRLWQLRDKIKNRISDLHWKTCKLLCDGFKTIFLPFFKTSEMVEKTPKRVISKKTVRKMLELSHCEFRTKLTYYAKTKQVEVILMNEEYTTKCCGHCGTLNDVGSSKVYRCDCGYTMDRDYHGARNLCIKTMS